ncbi:MAG: hypothetical protein ACOZIN_20225 [Myxococcota bacterium]
MSLLWAFLLAAPSLGTPLRQDGYVLRPPQNFRMARMDLFHGTRAGAAAGGAPGRWLSAALIDGQEEDASSLLVSIVERSFQPSPAARDDFSTAVVRHYADELGLKFSMERAELVAGASPRIEVLGTVRAQNQARHVLVAAMAGEGRHAVVTFSIPSGRYEALSGALRASLDSYRPDAPIANERSRGAVRVIAGLLAFALVASWWLRRRLRRR